MKIKEIIDKKIWEQFVLSDKNGSFLQSWNWGEFQRAMGEKVFRLGIFDQGKLRGTCLVIKIKAKRGIYLICPAGPLLNWKKKDDLRVLIKYLKEIAKREKALFIRIRPAIEDSPKNRSLFKSLGFWSAGMHLHAERTWLLDISPEEENLLAQMRKTTRYLIRKAIRDGVEIFQTNKIDDINYLYQLQKEAVARHHFIPFSENYFKKMFRVFSKDNQAALFLAKYKKEIISAALIMFYGQEAVYHYAATSSKYPKIPSSYLLVWEAILAAKRRNLSTFNFWGIAPPNRQEHRFAGLTLFKKGFGGQEKVFLHAQDLPLSGWYLVNWLIEAIRKKIRRL